MDLLAEVHAIPIRAFGYGRVVAFVIVPLTIHNLVVLAAPIPFVITPVNPFHGRVIPVTIVRFDTVKPEYDAVPTVCVDTKLCPHGFALVPIEPSPAARGTSDLVSANADIPSAAKARIPATINILFFTFAPYGFGSRFPSLSSSHSTSKLSFPLSMVTDASSSRMK